MTKSKIITPFHNFVKIEGFGGILLFISTILALAWANSPYAHYYTELWQLEFGFTLVDFTLKKPLILWINDGLMGIFFFLIGLEIKREFLIGELNSLRKISFPIFGALGGMLVPVLFFFFLNQNDATSGGWGIPMATDIAFSLAILNILGDRVPLSLKLFLTAFAIVDDIGAVLVIAVFYSSSIKIGLIGAALALLVISYTLSFRGYYSRYLTLTIGAVVWLLFLKSGIHPTIAGILMAFAIPVRQKIYTADFINNLTEITDKIKVSAVSRDPILTREQIEHVDELETWTEKFQSPLQHLEHALHGWVAYIILPIFAFANAGVAFTNSGNLDYTLITNIAICLVVGNSIGITAVITLAKKLRIIDMPSDITNRHLLGVAFLAGVGFTMAIFIASLAFADRPDLIDSAKIGVLLGSFVSAVLGYLTLRLTKRVP